MFHFFFLSLIVLLLPGNIAAHDYPHLQYHKTQETLDTIAHLITNEDSGIYYRFGDGEVGTAVNGSGSLEQQPNANLKKEMLEAFAMNSPVILKSLPLHCIEYGGYEEGMFHGYHLYEPTPQQNFAWCTNMLNTVKQFWGKEITDVYSQVAPHFAAVHNPDSLIRLLKVIKQKHTILVGNKNIPEFARKALFGEHCEFVPTPPRDAYAHINHIEQQCINEINKNDAYKVIIFAIGPTTNALQKRLWKQCDNIFLFDVGSLIDAMCGWNSRYWINLIHFNKDQFIQKLLQ